MSAALRREQFFDDGKFKIARRQKVRQGLPKKEGDDDSRLIIKMLYLQSGRKCDRGAKTGGGRHGGRHVPPPAGVGGVN